MVIWFPKSRKKEQIQRSGPNGRDEGVPLHFYNSLISVMVVDYRSAFIIAS